MQLGVDNVKCQLTRPRLRVMMQFWFTIVVWSGHLQSKHIHSHFDVSSLVWQILRDFMIERKNVHNAQHRHSRTKCTVMTTRVDNVSIAFKIRWCIGLPILQCHWLGAMPAHSKPLWTDQLIRPNKAYGPGWASDTTDQSRKRTQWTIKEQINERAPA